MNVIKTTVIISFLAMPIASMISHANGISDIKPDGTAISGKKKKRLNIRDVGAFYQADTGFYIGGYKPGKGNEYVNLIAYASNDLRDEKYWTIKNPVKKFFKFKNEIYALTYDGEILLGTKDNWNSGAWKVEPFSDIIYSDKFIIACHSRSPMKEGQEHGGCEAPEKKWSIVIDWLNVKPKMCDEKLAIMDSHLRAPFNVFQYDPETGKELARTIAKKLVTDVCTVKFD